MKVLRALLTLLTTITVPSAAQTVINGSRTLLGNWDASTAAATKPAKSGTVLPATCGIGEMFFKTDAAAGMNLQLCTATNTWTAIQGNGNSGTVTNTGGALTLDLPLFGAAGNDAKSGTKTGTGNQVVVSQSPIIVTPAIADFTNMAHSHANGAGGGQIGIAAVIPASLSGNGTKLGTISGTLTSGNCAKFDGNGNIVDNGANCGVTTPNYRQTFTNANSVVLTHNLNTLGVVFACYDNSAPAAWILPKTAGLTDLNNLTVTFASAQSGSCVVNATGGGGSATYNAGIGISIAGTTISVDSSSVPTYLTGAAFLAFGAIAQAACAQLNFTLTGASPGDAIAPGWPPSLEAGLVGNMIASASNTITVRLCNLTAAPLTPVNQVFKANIVRSF